MNSNLDSFCITLERTVEQAAALMDRNGLRIVLVVDPGRRLVGTVTDGDLRRAMLAHLDPNQPVKVLLERKRGSPFAQPITAPAGADRSEYLRLLQAHQLLHLPVVDDQRRVVGLVTLKEFVPDSPPSLRAVIMAGGRGSRLHPLTEHTPKPMLPIGDRPLLEILIEQLRESGIKRVNITTHHNGQKIADHFGDGRQFDVELNYVTEDRPLGTAGGLGLMGVPDETVLVINGDILTRVDFQAMLAFHGAQGADLTVGVRQYDMRVPFGVIECEGVTVRRLTEKPQLNFFVNAGIYLLEPSVYRFLPSGQPCDMTDLVQRLLDQGRPVVSFPIREYWLDIGQPADYEQAQEQAKDWKSRS